MPADDRTRLPLPWTVRCNDDAYWLEAGNGARFAYSYFRDRPLGGTGDQRLSREAARRVTVNLARLPQLLGKA